MLDLRGTVDYHKPVNPSSWFFIGWDEQYKCFKYKNAVDVFVFVSIVEMDEQLFHTVDFLWHCEFVQGTPFVDSILEDWGLAGWHKSGGGFFKEVSNGSKTPVFKK